MVFYSQTLAVLAALTLELFFGRDVFGLQLSSTSTFLSNRYSGFVPSSTNPTFARGKRNTALLVEPKAINVRRTGSIRMLVEASGRDALVELTKSDSPYSKTVRNTPRAIRKIASVASIPAVALAGFVATPSRKMIAHGVGGAIAAVGGIVGKSRLDIETIAAVKPALAQLLLDHEITDPDLSDDVAKLKKNFGISEEDFMETAEDVYRRYLIAMVKNPQTKHTEVSELTTLGSVLGLDNIAIGEAHSIGAEEVYRTTCTWTPEEELDDPEHPDRMSLDKFLFLSERAFRQNGETPEAFVFEFSRVSKAFKVSPQEALRRVANVAEPFYTRALATTRSKLDTGAVSGDMLKRARASLGIGENVAADMHLSTYADEVRALLGLETEGADAATCQFPEGALERLEKLRAVLNITEKDAAYEASVEVTPLFQATAQHVLKEATDYAVGNATIEPDMAKLWDELVARQSELCLSDENMAPLLDSVCIQTLGTPLEEASTMAGVNNDRGVYDKVMEAVKIKAAVSHLLASHDAVNSSMERYYDQDDRSACFQFLFADMRKKIYQMFLQRAVRDSSSGTDLPDKVREVLPEVHTVLGLDEWTVQDVAKIVCGPILEKALKAAAEEVTSGDADVGDTKEDGGGDSTSSIEERLSKLKIKNEELVKNLGVPSDLAKQYGREIYKNYLRFVQANSPAGIPTVELSVRLEYLANLLNLEEEEINPMQVATFGETFKRCVLEAMGATGIIVPEYRDSLEKLRGRLGVSLDDASSMFREAVRERMIPMVKRVEAELERSLLTKEQLSQKRGRDMGQDVFKGGKGPSGSLGIASQGNVMGDIMNLIDFYTENGIPEKKQVGTKTVKKKIGQDQDDAVTVEEPVYETTYPVTAIGVKAVEAEMAEAMYRQFVVGGFTAQGGQAARYEEAAPVFGGILGLPKEAIEEISGSVGSTVYENFIENSLRTKSALDQQDMMFLANIQGKLGLSSDKAEEMMVDAQKKVLKAQAEKLFDAENVFAADIKAFRERCNAMGLDLYSDLDILKGRIEGLFVMEVTQGIEKGQITTETTEDLQDIQESLGLTPEDCERVLFGLVRNRAEEAIDMINRELLRGREANCVQHIKDIIKFGAFAGGDLGLDVKKDRGNKIVSIYQASDLGDATSDEIDAQMELLKTCLGLMP